MKSLISPSSLVAIVSMALFAASVADVAAQDSPMTAPNSTATVSASQTAPVQLSFGAADVLKLSRAKVSDDTIATFIQNSGLAYGLDASAIVYLRNEGVSDRVITTMLNQQQNLAAAAAQTAPQTTTAPAAPAQSSADANSAQYAPTCTQPSTTYVQAVPASTVYVIPDSASYYYPYYSYYPYYAGYYGYGYPALSFSFGFGGYYGGRYYYGTGYRGGYYSGSGYRGGGYHGGGYAGGGYRGGGYAGGGYAHGGGSHGGGHR